MLDYIMELNNLPLNNIAGLGQDRNSGTSKIIADDGLDKGNFTSHFS